MATGERALIVGGSIAGLTAAHGLRRAGFDVKAFEVAPELWDVGTGIQLWVNAMSALEGLGIAEAVREVARPAEGTQLRSWRGGVLVSMDVGDMAREHGRPPPMFTLRPLLIKALGKGLDDVLDLGSKCIGFDQDADGVTVRLEDGREERGAFLVGADGIDSTIRPRLFPGNDPMYAGYTYIRAYGPPFEHPSFPPNRFALTLGPGKRFGINPAGDYTDWFAVVPTEKADGLDGNGLRRLVLEEFAAFPAGIPEVVEATEGGKIFATNVRHLRPLKRWADGRVVLIGDAAHAPAPDLGRGASEAVVDSFVLTECLTEGDVARGGDPAAALAAFEQRRIRDATKFQASARRIGGQMMWANPVAWRVRDVVMKRIAGPQITKETVAELAGDAA